MHKLAELCVRRPVFASVLVLSLVVMGLFSYFQLGVDRFPNIDFPFVTITTRLVGAAPEEMETVVQGSQRFLPAREDDGALADITPDSNIDNTPERRTS